MIGVGPIAVINMDWESRGLKGSAVWSQHILSRQTDVTRLQKK